jgi:AcrR family transcriptional regulator
MRINNLIIKYFYLETLISKKVSIVSRSNIQAKIMEVKDRILEKANELYMRYGIKSITMDEIAGHLGISKKTIYQFYADKDALVSAVFLRIINENRGMCCLSRDNSDNAIHEQFLCSDVVQVYAEFDKYKREFIYEMIKSGLERGVAEGLFRNDMSIDIIARLQLETIALLHETEFVHKHGLSAIEKELNEFFLHGSATPKGKELITTYKLQRQNKQ